MDIKDYKKSVETAAEFLSERIGFKPRVAIVLGSGLSGIAHSLQDPVTIPYSEIPSFPVSTAPGHKGELIFGKLNGKNTMLMNGRFHFYEGYTMQQVTFPVRVMQLLEVEVLIVTNAAGGLNPTFEVARPMIITDHINFMGDNPLRGPNVEEWGPRFPDMSEPYNLGLIALAEKVALDQKIKVQKGVYVAVPGPNLETKAEYRFLRGIGADVVGMSTVPENIVANHMGMKVLGFSIVTDECFPDKLEKVNVEDIIAAANNAEPKMTSIMKEVIERL